MGFGSRAFLAGGLGFAAAFVVACGSSNGLLSADENSSLTSQLNSISSALASHQCGEVDSAAAALTNAVANLPPSVTTTLVQNLGQGAGTISQLATRDCTSSTASTSTSTSTSTSSTPTSTTSSTTSSTSTSTSSSITTPTSQTGTSATNPSGTGTSTTSNGGAGIGATGTSGSGQGNGGNGVGGGNGQ
jgi:hypothetical protein